MFLIAWLQDILNRLGKNSDSAAMDSTVFAALKSVYNAATAGGADISVPDADSTANADVCDVVGNKTDAAVTTVGTTKSIVAYVKGLLGELAKVPKSDGSATWNATALAAITTQCTSSLNSYDPPTRSELTADIAVPSADATANTDMADVIGNKTDAAADDVATTKSLMAYLKGLVQELDQRKMGKTAVYSGSVTTSGVDVINISDKGVLTCVCVNLYDYEVTVTITIDGTALSAFTWTPGSSRSNASLSFNHRFDSSLRVRIVATGSTSNIAPAVVTYTIDN